jgi:prepilin-type processing-associated H-X9-DG protein
LYGVRRVEAPATPSVRGVQQHRRVVGARIRPGNALFVDGHAPPYVIAIAALEEGPRLVGNVRGIEPDQLALDVPMVVEIEPVSDSVGLLWFRPS